MSTFPSIFVALFSVLFLGYLMHELIHLIVTKSFFIEKIIIRKNIKKWIKSELPHTWKYDIFFFTINRRGCTISAYHEDTSNTICQEIKIKKYKPIQLSESNILNKMMIYDHSIKQLVKRQKRDTKISNIIG